MTQALLPLLKVRRQIVFINSSQGLAARANTGPYAAAQHALKALADSLRQEVNADGIRVLSVYPGRTATARMKSSLYEIEGRKYQPELLMERRVDCDLWYIKNWSFWLDLRILVLTCFELVRSRHAY